MCALSPEHASDVLQQRQAVLVEQLDMLLKAAGGNDGPMPPRVTLLETEYLVEVTRAELSFVSNVIADLRSGALAWTEEELMETARQFMGE